MRMMRSLTSLSVSAVVAVLAASPVLAQRQVLPTAIAPIDSADPVALMVARLDLEQYRSSACDTKNHQLEGCSS